MVKDPKWQKMTQKSHMGHWPARRTARSAYNSPGLGPVGVSDHQISALSIFSNCFRNFCNRSQLKQPFSLQSKSTQAAIFEQFFDFELQSTQTWTQIRTELGHKFEPQFELELKSSLNSSSSNCLLLFSAPARRRPLSRIIRGSVSRSPWTLTCGACFQVGGPPFLI